MACYEIFAKNLRTLLQQLGISSVQLAKSIGVDPSLVSRWRRQGCSGRNANAYALAIAGYITEKNHSPQNHAWLHARLSELSLPASAPDVARLALWLYPEADVSALMNKEDGFVNLLVVNSFRNAVLTAPGSTAKLNLHENAAENTVSAVLGAEEIVLCLRRELAAMDGLTPVLVHLSSEGAGIITHRQIISALQEAVRARALQVRMLVQSANNSIASSKLVSAYMPLLVSGNLELCVIQSTPQTFTTTVNFVLPGQAALTITETPQKNTQPVLTTVRDRDVVDGMRRIFFSDVMGLFGESTGA